MRVNYTGPTTPHPVGHGLGCSPFARHYLGNHCCFLFLRVLRCFSSPGMPPRKDIPCGMGCPIRKSTDHSSFAAPRSLSQLYTSFIASTCLGIHRVPLLASFIWLARPATGRTYLAFWFYCGPGGDEPHLATYGALHIVILYATLSLIRCRIRP